MSNEKKIIFISYNNSIGSDNLRVKQIVNILNYNNIVIIPQCVEKTNIHDPNFIKKISLYKKSIFIWIALVNIDGIKITKKNNNINIFDCVDKYIYYHDNINYMLNNNLINCLIVNSNYMKSEILSRTRFKGNIFIIYHHYDIIFEKTKIINQDRLTFGYMGSLPSLSHTDNFLYYKKLMVKFPIEFLNTEDGVYYTNDIKHNVILKGQPQKLLDNLSVNFNCHISIRQFNTKVSKYKTTAKIATASFFNHNIITTYEEAVKDILPPDYPFLLKSDKYEVIEKMFQTVINDYNGTKELWNKGLEIMKTVKEKLNIQIIKKDYENIIKIYSK
jgi:hypothetical protein